MHRRTRFRVELDERWGGWDRWCAERGMTLGEGARQLIAAALRAETDDRDAIAGTITSSGGLGPFMRVVVRLTPGELDVVERRAVAAGLSRNRWIVALIRAGALGEPHFDGQEMRLLAESNQQLALVNRYLAQIARNAIANNVALSELQGVEAIRARIDTHLRLAAAMVRANLERWRQ